MPRARSPRPARPAKTTAKARAAKSDANGATSPATAPVVRIRRMHRRDIKRAWEFLKVVFRDVNRQTVEYQRPLTRRQFEEVYEEQGIEQLLFEIGIGKKAR